MITWCCKPDCPGRHPACHGTCEKYKAWAAAVKAEKAYTKDMVSRDRVNRSDYVKEGPVWRRSVDSSSPSSISPRRRSAS